MNLQQYPTPSDGGNVYKGYANDPGLPYRRDVPSIRITSSQMYDMDNPGGYSPDPGIPHHRGAHGENNFDHRPLPASSAYPGYSTRQHSGQALLIRDGGDGRRCLHNKEGRILPDSQNDSSPYYLSGPARTFGAELLSGREGNNAMLWEPLAALEHPGRQTVPLPPAMCPAIGPPSAQPWSQPVPAQTAPSALQHQQQPAVHSLSPSLPCTHRSPEYSAPPLFQYPPWPHRQQLHILQQEPSMRQQQVNQQRPGSLGPADYGPSPPPLPFAASHGAQRPQTPLQPPTCPEPAIEHQHMLHQSSQLSSHAQPSRALQMQWSVSTRCAHSAQPCVCSGPSPTFLSGAQTPYQQWPHQQKLRLQQQEPSLLQQQVVDQPRPCSQRVPVYGQSPLPAPPLAHHGAQCPPPPLQSPHCLAPVYCPAPTVEQQQTLHQSAQLSPQLGLAGALQLPWSLSTQHTHSAQPRAYSQPPPPCPHGEQAPHVPMQQYPQCSAQQSTNGAIRPTLPLADQRQPSGNPAYPQSAFHGPSSWDANGGLHAQFIHRCPATTESPAPVSLTAPSFLKEGGVPHIGADSNESSSDQFVRLVSQLAQKIHDLDMLSENLHWSSGHVYRNATGADDGSAPEPLADVRSSYTSPDAWLSDEQVAPVPLQANRAETGVLKQSFADAAQTRQAGPTAQPPEQPKASSPSQLSAPDLSAGHPERDSSREPRQDCDAGADGTAKHAYPARAGAGASQRRYRGAQRRHKDRVSADQGTVPNNKLRNRAQICCNRSHDQRDSSKTPRAAVVMVNEPSGEPLPKEYPQEALAKIPDVKLAVLHQYPYDPGGSELVMQLKRKNGVFKDAIVERAADLSIRTSVTATTDDTPYMLLFSREFCYKIVMLMMSSDEPLRPRSKEKTFEICGVATSDHWNASSKVRWPSSPTIGRARAM